MALNWTMLNSDRTPVPIGHEMTITTVDSGSDLTLIIPNAPPSGSSTAGGSGGSKKLKESGKLYITDQRLIFVGPAKSPLDSLSVPLHQILSSKFEQPLLGSNYLALEIAPSPEGGLVRGTRAEVRIRDQGLFRFVNVLAKTREHAIETRAARQPEEEEGLPSYSNPPDAAGPSTSGSSSSYAAPPPAGSGPAAPSDAPPAYDA